MFTTLPKTPKERIRFGFIRAVTWISFGSVALLIGSTLGWPWQMFFVIVGIVAILLGYAYALFGVCGLWHQQECEQAACKAKEKLLPDDM